MSIIDKRTESKESQLERLEDRVATLDQVIETARPQDKNYIDGRQREERQQIANDVDLLIDDIVKLNEDKLPLQRLQLEQEGEIGFYQVCCRSNIWRRECQELSRQCFSIHICNHICIRPTCSIVTHHCYRITCKSSRFTPKTRNQEENLIISTKRKNK